MKACNFWVLGTVSDVELQSGLIALLGSSSRTEARIVAHLAEVDTRKLALRDGYESTFAYCQRRLGLSENEAFRRIAVARVARRFPVVFELIDQRKLHLTAICLLREHLTPENHEQLLAAAMGKTKGQLEEWLAGRFPKARAEDSVRKLPAPRESDRPSLGAASASPASASVPGVPACSAGGAAGVPLALSASGDVLPAGRRTNSAKMQPIADQLYRVQFDASRRFKEKLDLARALASHSNPSGKFEEIFEQALDLWLERIQKRRFAQTDSPRTKASSSRTSSIADAAKQVRSRRQRIANAVRREVAARDELRCSYVGPNGLRCTAQAFLQLHHERAWAHGGSDSADNLHLHCAAHNRLQAERDFGSAHIARRIVENQSARVSKHESDRKKETQ